MLLRLRPLRRGVPLRDPFQALGNPQRRAIVRLLAHRERSVQELAKRAAYQSTRRVAPPQASDTSRPGLRRGPGCTSSVPAPGRGHRLHPQLRGGRLGGSELAFDCSPRIRPASADRDDRPATHFARSGLRHRPGIRNLDCARIRQVAEAAHHHARFGVGNYLRAPHWRSNFRTDEGQTGIRLGTGHRLGATTSTGLFVAHRGAAGGCDRRRDPVRSAWTWHHSRRHRTRRLGPPRSRSRPAMAHCESGWMDGCAARLHSGVRARRVRFNHFSWKDLMSSEWTGGQLQAAALIARNDGSGGLRGLP
jgi:hypothetical protein